MTAFSGMALLRPQRGTGLLPVPERNHLLTGGSHLRLVVQREMRVHDPALRTQREPLQVHTAAFAQVPRGLQRTSS